MGASNGAGDAPQASDQLSQPIIGTFKLGTDVSNIYDNSASESQLAYNELVPPTYQPLADPITTNYLGQARP